MATTTEQILAMMKDEAVKNFAENKGTAEWTESAENMFRYYLENATEEQRLEVLADEEGREKYSLFGLVMMKIYKPLGGLKEEKEEEEEVYGECYECGKEGKFIGKEGDDWICEECYDFRGGRCDSESDEQDTDGSDEDLNGAIAVSGSAF